MPASDQHPEYIEHRKQWTMVRDCVDGPSAIRKKRTQYLPMPNPEDKDKENEARYDSYVERASFVNFTGMTLEGLLGMVFRRPLKSELQSSIDYLEDNIDGSGITLDQMVRALCSNVLQTGRFGLLTDYPEAPEGLTSSEVTELNLRANILPYKAEAIKNWDTEIIGGVTVLSMVVLEEEHKEYAPDGFSYEAKKYHRVLSLIDGAILPDIIDGADKVSGKIYIQMMFDEGDKLVSVTVPRKSDRAYWDRIPFSFVGAQNNDPEVDKAPLYDIADVNIAHYRNSADFEESSFMVGQPTLTIMGLSQSWVDEVMKGGVMLGSRRALLGPEGASADLLQANPNQMPQLGMEMKEGQMVKLGARIIQEQRGNETAEAVKTRFAGQNSKLATVVGNIEAALIQCFGWTMEFMGGSGENEIDINREFFDKSVDPQLVMARIQLLDRGVIAKSDLQDKLRIEGEIAQDRSNEEIDGEAEETVML
jgi:hypothetical protein